MSGPSWSRSRASLVFFLLLLTGFLALCLFMTGPYLLAVFVGVVLSMLASPLYARLVLRGWGHGLAAGVVTTAVTFLVIGPICLLTFIAIKQAIAVGHELADNPMFSIEGLLGRLSEWGPVRTLIGEPAALEKQFRSGLQSAGKATSGFLLDFLGLLPDFLLQLVLALLTCFFSLVDGKAFRNWLLPKVPLESDVATGLISTFHGTTISVIWATLAAAAVQAALMFLAFLALGVPGAFLAGGATFVFAWIPMVGSLPVWLIGAIYLYAKGSIAKAVVMVGLGAFTGVIDNYIRPLILKGRNELHPLVSLVVIFGGISMFGIFGVFIGPVLVSGVISLMEVWPSVARRSGMLNGDA